MENQIKQSKIIKAFCVVGLNLKHLKKYSEEDSKYCYIQNIQLVNKIGKENIDKMEIEGQKWLRICKNNSYWLTIKYSLRYNEPITGFNVIGCEYESPEYLLVPRKYIDKGYKPIQIINDDDNDTNTFHSNEQFQSYNDYYLKIPSNYNVKKKLHFTIEEEAAVVLISKSTTQLPLKDIEILQGDKGYQFGLIRNKSPYLSKYNPELLDTYPIDTDTVNPSISMFCFPEGIALKETREMPKWFNFILTNENGEQTYGSVLIFMEPILNNDINSFIPQYQSKTMIYTEKAICIISNYPFFNNCLIFLRQLYRIQVSSFSIFPLERAIGHFVDSLCFQGNTNNGLSFTFAEEELKFFQMPVYGLLWDTTDDNIRKLLELISFENIITLWEGLLLEKKLILLSQSKFVLSNITLALISLLFPFKWNNIIVPVLPEKLKVFVESPVPYIIGICFPIQLSDLPNDALIFNIDSNCFEYYIDKIPRLPNKLNKIMMAKVSKFKVRNNYKDPITQYESRKDRIMLYDEVFPLNSHDGIQLNHDNLNIYDSSEFRDIFYIVFIHMFNNYDKYFNSNQKKKDKEPTNESSIFQQDIFLNDHSSNNIGSFLYSFCETSLFAQLVNSFKYLESNSSISFFINTIIRGKGQSKYYLPITNPSITSVITEIPINDLNNEIYSYPENFPQLNHKLFIKAESPKLTYKSRFIYTHDEWCSELNKMNTKEWGKYIIYSIYEIWIIFLTFTISHYDDKKAYLLMEYVVFILEDLLYKKKIYPSKNILIKIIKSCARNCLNSFIQPLVNLSNVNSEEYKMIFHDAFKNELYTMAESIQYTRGLFEENDSNNNYRLIKSSKDELYKLIFLNGDICLNCLKNNRKRIIIPLEDIIIGFNKSKSDYSSICPHCFTTIYPKIHFINESQYSLMTKNFSLLSPIVLLKEVDNIIQNKGEQYFFKNNYFNDINYSHIYYNLVLYFKIMSLPIGILFILNEDADFIQLASEINESRQKSQRHKKLSSKLNNSNSSFKHKNNKNSIDFNQNSINSYLSNDSTTPSFNSSIDDFCSSKKYEQEIWSNIKSKMEKLVFNESNKLSIGGRNQYKNKLNNLKGIISYDINNYVERENNRLEKFFLLYEFNIMMNNQQKQDNDNNNKQKPNTPFVSQYSNVNKVNIPLNPKISFFPFDTKRSLNYKVVIKSSKDLISSSLLLSGQKN